MTQSIDEFSLPPLALPLAQLNELFPLCGNSPPNASARRLDQWKMEDDDAPIFQFLYQAHRPGRHLEFGTWQGWGASYCVEACAATVWTINLPNGERRSDGTAAYHMRVIDTIEAPRGIAAAIFGKGKQSQKIYHRTDAGDYIGRIYREKGLGNRVCQIYCDSRDWDTSNYPTDFFDSVLIDGGHQPEVVINDSRKALQVLRSGGLIMWHDFCPLPDIRLHFDSVKGVTAGIEAILPMLKSELEKLYWINPSWILVGIKK